MPETATIDEARGLVAAVVADDMTDAQPDEDLRDWGLDSIRLTGLLSGLRRTGVSIELEEIAGEPTLAGLADALERARA